MLQKLFNLIFPPKCILCRQLLSRNETDICHSCRKDLPECKKSNLRFSFVAGWTSVWYYKDNIRGSIRRFKFSGRRHYARPYSQFLAMKLQKEDFCDFDILTYVPTAFLRRLRRGYDQMELLCNEVGKELGVTPVKTLRKVRNTPPQSGIKDISRRRANVLGAYQAACTESLAGKRILLLDDVITTGATISECARVLLTAGAKEVFCASMAVTQHNKKM